MQAKYGVAYTSSTNSLNDTPDLAHGPESSGKVAAGSGDRCQEKSEEKYYHWTDSGSLLIPFQGTEVTGPCMLLVPLETVSGG